jgi:hypothetical protein
MHEAQKATFEPVDTIPSNTHPGELLRKIQGCQRDGLPLVITGVVMDPEWPHQRTSGDEFGEERAHLERTQGVSLVTISQERV